VDLVHKLTSWNKEQGRQAGQARDGQKLCKIEKQHTMKELKQNELEGPCTADTMLI
jgi:hypothetical protein